MLARFLAISMLAAPDLSPQSLAPPSFEVATIKPADPAAQGQRVMLSSPGRISINNMTLVDLARFAYGEGLGTNLQINGLGNEYVLELEFTFTPPNLNGAATVADPLGPSIFTAVQEQWGLKLESAKGQADVLMIDGADRPSEN